MVLGLWHLKLHTLPMRHGFLLIDKPTGPTSHDIVGQVRRLLGERSIGHLGTLDPFASGLLMLAVGSKALKVIELFSGLEKEYELDVVLGAVSTTYDPEGTITSVERPLDEKPTMSDVQVAINRKFLGTIDQRPPDFSAVKVGGERAYRKARQGKAIDMPTRQVTIHTCQVQECSYPHMRVLVSASAGTYMRSLAHDLGHVLRCGAYLAGLRRTKVGDWKIEDAITPDRAAWGNVLPLKEILKGFTGFQLSEREWNDISHGRSIEHRGEELVGWYEDLPVALLEKDPKKEGFVKARKVL